MHRAEPELDARINTRHLGCVARKVIALREGREQNSRHGPRYSLHLVDNPSFWFPQLHVFFS